MSIVYNLTALGASRQLGINTQNRARSAQRLGSGYRINSAADDAAGLTISEKMRAQIRGLNKASKNAQDGASFIQVADGGMSEVHAILHRMNELTIQALNDTNTEADRAALAAEFDQLQSEIDRINDDTQFNTLGVFEDHAEAYYQIAGNCVWDAAQQHSIVAPDNDLVVVLGDNHSPSEYTITIPDGIYTTQELVDEIEDAFSNLQPSNPGLELEFTDDGCCNLNFESLDGLPVEVKTVEGALSYLIYDCYNGKTTASLLGTTAFQGDWPLSITKGQNDELSFYIENNDGSGSKQVSIIIPEGEYSRFELIELLNKEIELEDPAVVAKEYGTNCIQITGGTDKSITGLKGNMFKLETGTEKVYTSVFYDNSKYGTSVTTDAKIVGKAYFGVNGTSSTAPLNIDSSNNILRFSLDGGITYQNITIGEKTDYTLGDLVSELNNRAKNVGAEVEFSASDVSYTAPSGGTWGYYSTLIMTSTADEVCELEFDTSGVYGNTYNSLFCDTKFSYDKPAAKNAGSHLYCSSVFAPVTIENGKNTLSISLTNVDPSKNFSFNVNIPENTYNTLADLVNALNGQLSAYQAEEIEFISYSSRLAIKVKDPEVSDISLDTSTDAYKELFSSISEVAISETASGSGSESYPQGGTAPDFTPATITLKNRIPSSSVTVDSNNDTIYFNLNGNSETVSLSHKRYNSPSEIVADLNQKLIDKGLGVVASINGGALCLTTTLTGSEMRHSLSVNTSSGDGWKTLVGTTMKTSSSYYSAKKEYYQGYNTDYPFVINDDNYSLKLTYNGVAHDIEMDKVSYATIGDMVRALQSKIDDKLGKTANGYSKVNVEANSNGLKLTASSPGSSMLTLSGSFYDRVIGGNIVTTKTATPSVTDGKHTFSDAYIVGREDLTDGSVQIVTGLNDKFIIDFTHTSYEDSANDFMHTLELTIPEGVYSGQDIVDILQEQLDNAFADKGLDSTLEVEVSIGGHKTGVIGSNDDTALQITVSEKKGTQSDNGTYILDGVRGSAAYYIFYKTSGKPVPSYVTGTEDLTDGVKITSENNAFTFTSDGVDYSYTFPEAEYTAEEFIQMFDDMLNNGDDSGKVASLDAILEDGCLKISHKVYGSHTIENIDGSAKGTIFYHEESREQLEPFILQIGALEGHNIELPRIRVGTTALKINSVTISKPKYAQKALDRLGTALEKLNQQRSLYGAYYNRLEHVVSTNDNTAENVQASESLIRDANMADEMVAYSKSSILEQAAQAILVQANQINNGIVKLLE